MIDIDSLHNLERKVLIALREFGDGLTLNVIKERANLSEGEINKAIEWLKGKGLIKVDEDVKQKFKLTEIGEKCAKEGMPEKRFLLAIKDGPLGFKELIQKANLDKDEFNSAIGFLKEEGLIKIEDGKIHLTELGNKRLQMPWKEDKLFHLLKDWIYFDEIPIFLREVVPFLEDRGIIEKKDSVIRTIYLTEEGKKILPKVRIEDKIDLLTPKMILDGSWKGKSFRKYDISAPAPPIYIGKKQPYLKFVDEVKEKLISLGFQETKGPLVELAFFNNDLLFMPQDHPAREIHDIYFIERGGGDLSRYKQLLEKTKKVHEYGWETGSTGWGYKFDKNKSKDIILRSHTTAVSIRTLLSKDLKIPGKYFTIGRVYRPDVIDWKHLTEFDQLDGIILGDQMTFRELLGVLKKFAIEFGGAKKVKFVPGYFPFTEPSVELHVYMEGKGWMEIGGAGIFRPEVTLPLGIEVPVIAWGLGILRLFMTKYNIKDMRQVFSNDLKWLREFRWKNANN
ncbi:MAG: phenylalanine--tRNA ligase subunit alpha [Nanoarchaeota archaeon]|nr:phenylalanine--tRNA ligase subunit alpha [Nanoarchaeota archaeon]